MTYSFVPNYHNNKTGKYQTGHVVISSANYFARWEHTTPDKLYVRSTSSSTTDWLEFIIGGYCDFSDGKHKPDLSTYCPIFETDETLKRTTEWDHTLRFQAKSYANGEYVYRLHFEENRISFSFSYSFDGAFDLQNTFYGTLGDETGSKIYGECIFNPSPVSHSLFCHRLNQPQVSGSTGELWFAPAPFCFPIKIDESLWNSFSIFPESHQLKFSSYKTQILQNDTLCFGLDYSSEPPFTSQYDAPILCIQFNSHSPFEALEKYRDGLVETQKINFSKKEPVSWWRGIMVCGWHNQEVLGGSKACTQQIYEQHLEKYEETGIDYDIVTIDDFWGKSYGIWEVDTDKWPDLRGFIEKLHQKGKKVLLWVCIRTDGLPDDEVYIINESRMLDPCNTKYQTRLYHELTHMLSDAKDCLNADGIKLDFIGGVPAAGNILSCTTRLYGQEYLHTLYKLIYDTAKKIKADSLLDLQVANPHFADCYDMSRINDFYLPYSQALESMRTRAYIAQSVGFGSLVDTDHPAHEEYFANSYQFGNISLYLTNEQLNNTQWVHIIKNSIQEFKKMTSFE